MGSIFGKDDGNKVVRFYQNASSAWHDTRDSLSYVLTDYWFKCSSERIAALVRQGGQNAFVYRFQHNVSFPKLFPQYGLPTICEQRTCHASELPFVFHNAANYSFATAETAMSADFVAYWTAFAKTGNVNPDAGSTPMKWPLFDSASRLNMRMAAASDANAQGVESTKTGQSGALPTAGVCDFFDEQVGYNH